MSFVGKFKPGTNNNSDVPQGVKIENTSFGYQQNQKPYVKPQLQKDLITTQKTKPRGGWDDDDDNESQLRGNSGPFKGNQTTQQATTKANITSPLSSNSNKSDDLALGPNTKKSNPAIDFELIPIDEKFLSDHEYENKTINDLIQPDGARLKQPDNVLANFCKACESFQVPVASSLLLSKLYEDIPFVSKARTCFLIEALAKKVKKYYAYLHHNLHILKDYDCSNEGSNAEQLAKLIGDIVKYIENPNPPKPTVVAPTTTQTTQQKPTTSLTNNIFGDDDLLSPAQTNAKQDPFEFIKKTGPATTATTQAQFTSNQSTANQQNLGLLDFQPTSQPQSNQIQQIQPINQTQAPTKKFDPFGLAGATNNTAQTTSQSSTNKASNLPGSFNKFQPNNVANTSNQQKPGSQNNLGGSQNNTAETNTDLLNAAPTSTATKFDQLDDLLDSFSGLDFSGNNVNNQAPTNQGGTPQNTSTGQAKAPNNQGLQGQGFPNTLQNQQKPFNQPQGFPNQQNQGFGGMQPQNQQGAMPQGQGFPQTQGFGPMPTQTHGQPMMPHYPVPNNAQFYPPYGGAGGPGFGQYPGYPGPGPGPNPYWGRGYPQYPTAPGYGYGQQPQFGTGYPTGPSAYQGQPGTYGNNQFQGQGQSGTNPYQNQPGMPNQK